MSDRHIGDSSEAEEPPTVFPPLGSIHVVLPLSPEEQTLAERARNILFDAEMAGLVLEHLPDAIVVVDEAGVIQGMNVLGELLSGYRRAELIGQPIERLVPEAQRQTHETARRIYMEDSHPRPLDLGLPLHIRRKTGGAVPVNIALFPLVTTRGTWVIASVRPPR